MLLWHQLLHDFFNCQIFVHRNNNIKKHIGAIHSAANTLDRFYFRKSATTCFVLVDQWFDSKPSDNEKALSLKISMAVFRIRTATTIAVRLSSHPQPKEAAKMAMAVPMLVQASLRLSLAAASSAELFTCAANLSIKGIHTIHENSRDHTYNCRKHIRTFCLPLESRTRQRNKVLAALQQA